MKSFELIITIIFVVLISMSVVQCMPSYLGMPFLILLLIILFIRCDNIGKISVFDSYNISDFLNRFSKTQNKLYYTTDNDIKVEEIVDDIKLQRSTIKNEVEIPTKFKDILTPDYKQNAESPTYDEYKYRENLFPDASCSGDYLLSEKMKHMGLQPKVSIDSHARVNKYSNYAYFAEELDSHANSRWWDDETLEDEF
jgi:hypothetical protein